MLSEGVPGIVKNIYFITCYSITESRFFPDIGHSVKEIIFNAYLYSIYTFFGNKFIGSSYIGSGDMQKFLSSSCTFNYISLYCICPSKEGRCLKDLSF